MARDQAFNFGKRMAELGWVMITGGGPGIMQALHDGATSVRSDAAFACQLELPVQELGASTAAHGCMHTRFFPRKATMWRTDAFGTFVGGMGSLDEFYEALAMAKTGKIDPPIPILVVRGGKGEFADCGA